MAQYLVTLAVGGNCELLADFLGGQMFTAVLHTLLTEVSH
jgi:hypothetical protein